MWSGLCKPPQARLSTRALCLPNILAPACFADILAINEFLPGELWILSLFCISKGYTSPPALSGWEEQLLGYPIANRRDTDFKEQKLKSRKKKKKVGNLSLLEIWIVKNDKGVTLNRHGLLRLVGSRKPPERIPTAPHKQHLPDALPSSVLPLH